MESCFQRVQNESWRGENEKVINYQGFLTYTQIVLSHLIAVVIIHMRNVETVGENPFVSFCKVFERNWCRIISDYSSRAKPNLNLIPLDYATCSTVY